MFRKKQGRRTGDRSITRIIGEDGEIFPMDWGDIPHK